MRRAFLLLVFVLACGLLSGWGQSRGNVTATADPEVICLGESSQLHAEATTNDNLIIDFETGNFSQFDFNNDQTYPWIIFESPDNGSSYCMRSGNKEIPNSSSTISAMVEFTDYCKVSFDAKCMGEGTNIYWDRCIFSIDNVEQFANGANVSNWNNYSYYVSPGTHILSWSYTKDGSVDPLGDAFFVDNIAFSRVDVFSVVIDFETGDFSQGNFSNNSTYPWVITNGTSSSGLYCMKSGNYNIYSSSSTIQLTYNFIEDGQISFDAKCRGETSYSLYSIYDKCIFYIDGIKQFEYGNEGDIWLHFVFFVSSGSHTFKWEYTKDSSVDSLGDAFFIDNIILQYFTPSPSDDTDVTFQWSDGNSIVGTGPDITVTPAQTTTYTVSAYQDDDLVGTAQQTVAVYQDPELSITTNTGSSEICEGDTIVLYVTVGGSVDVRAGDILCTDGSLVRPTQWPCGKTAKGVVFYVDATGQHGWAVDLDYSVAPGTTNLTMKWSSQNQTISGLQTYSLWMDAISDLDGKSNTQKIRSFGTASNYPAAWSVDFDNGWYLPAIGQLNLLYGEYFAVNSSLDIVGGVVMSSGDLWSSSVRAMDKAYMVRINNGYINAETKSYTKYVRAVIDF